MAKKRGRDPDDGGAVLFNSSGNSNRSKRPTGSPSARHLAELSLQNEHYNRELRERLEEQEKKTGKKHREALLAAAREHARILLQVQQEQECERLAKERERQLAEEETARLLEQERAEAMQRQIAEQRRRAAEKKRLDELEAIQQREQIQLEEEERKRAEELARQKQQIQEKLIADARKAEEEEQRKQEAAKKAEADKTAAAATPAPATLSPSTGLVTSVGERDADHKKYLDLHARLKQMRSTVRDQCNANKTLKKQVGDARREIRSRIGQVTNGKGGTTAPRAHIAKMLKESLALTDPTVDIRAYMVSQQLPTDQPDAAYRVSAVFVYLMNIFTKGIIQQWVDVASADVPAANATGVLVISILADETLRILGAPMIDILLAKLHKVCPVLFGIYGPENTVAGKVRLGWDRDRLEKNKPFVGEQRHGDRMTGLGAGFSAIGLRVFPPTTKLRNPFPPLHWWRAFARIVNTPAGEITNTHLIVLKAMVQSQAPRIIEIFKNVGRAALRVALVDFPAKAPKGAARTGVEVLRATLAKEHNIQV